jgi:hypothetical protein
MDWPIRFPAEMSSGTVSVRSYEPADIADLFLSGGRACVGAYVPDYAGRCRRAGRGHPVQARGRLPGDLYRPAGRAGCRHYLCQLRSSRPGTRGDRRHAARSASVADWSQHGGQAAPARGAVPARGLSGSSCAPTSGTGGRPPQSASSAPPTSARARKISFVWTAPRRQSRIFRLDRPGASRPAGPALHTAGKIPTG